MLESVIRFGLVLGDFGGDFDLAWMLSERENNPMIGFLNKSVEKKGRQEQG